MLQISAIGNIGIDAKLHNTNGQSFTTFSVAISESYTKEDGTKVENTTWVNCIYNNVNLVKYLLKGTKVYIQGRLSVKVVNSAKDKKNYAGIDCKVNFVELVSSKPKATEPTPETVDPETGEILNSDSLPY